MFKKFKSIAKWVFRPQTLRHAIFALRIANSLHMLENIFDCPVVESYGLSEVGTICCNPVDKELRKVRSVGKVVKGVQIEIRDSNNQPLSHGNSGEIFAKSGAMVNGYVETGNNSDFVDGWFRSGDMGYFDKKGYLYIQGRKSDSIIIGGKYYFPEDLEAYIAKISGSKECVVINLNKDKDYLVAYLVNQQSLSLDEINSHLKSSKFNTQLKEVRECTTLEYNPIGKPLKVKFRASVS